MPNGRQRRLQLLSCQVSGTAPRDLRGNRNWSQFGGAGKASVAATDLAERLEHQGKEDVPVEEHDHSWYIAHLGTNYNFSVAIEETSPLYGEFRRCLRNGK
jgi:hypothetical protein